jgi:glycosyltransferase involved in cell wall biosynthesis
MNRKQIVRSRVLHIITRLDLGGAQQNTLHTVEHLDQNHFDACLLCGRGGFLDETAQARIPVTFCSNLVRSINPVMDVAALIELRRLIASSRSGDAMPLIVHTHCSKAGILGRAASRLVGPDVLVHTYHGFTYHTNRMIRKGFRTLEYTFRDLADAFFFVSKRDMQQAQNMGLLERTHGYLVRSGISLRSIGRFSNKRFEVRAELGINGQDPVIVTVANFKPHKNPLLGLKAFARVLARLPDAKWVFVGGGDRAEFDNELARRCLEPHVRILGWRQDVPHLLAAGDVYMLPSDFEGLPRSILEAIAAGLPIVSTDVGGISEVVDDRVGVLVQKGDAKALADGVIYMLNAKPDVRSVARKLLAEFDINTMVQHQESIYEELISRRLDAMKRPFERL